MDPGPLPAASDSVGTEERARQRPHLWHPNLAAAWSLLLTPAFGAWVHMRNWEALGEQAKARASRRWMIAIILVQLILILWASRAPHALASSLSRLAPVVSTAGWYLWVGREQVDHVEANCANDYVRRGWLLPLATALVLTASVFYWPFR